MLGVCFSRAAFTQLVVNDDEAVELSDKEAENTSRRLRPSQDELVDAAFFVAMVNVLDEELSIDSMKVTRPLLLMSLPPPDMRHHVGGSQSPLPRKPRGAAILGTAQLRAGGQNGAVTTLVREAERRGTEGVAMDGGQQLELARVGENLILAHIHRLMGNTEEAEKLQFSSTAAMAAVEGRRPSRRGPAVEADSDEDESADSSYEEDDGEEDEDDEDDDEDDDEEDDEEGDEEDDDLYFELGIIFNHKGKSDPEKAIKSVATKLSRPSIRSKKECAAKWPPDVLAGVWETFEIMGGIVDVIRAANDLT